MKIESQSSNNRAIFPKVIMSNYSEIEKTLSVHENTHKQRTNKRKSDSSVQHSYNNKKTKHSPTFTKKDCEDLLTKIGENIFNDNDLTDLEFAEACLVYMLTQEADLFSLDWVDLKQNYMLDNSWSEKVVYILANYASSVKRVDEILAENRKRKKKNGWLKAGERKKKVFMSQHISLPIHLLEKILKTLKISKKQTLLASCKTDRVKSF